MVQSGSIADVGKSASSYSYEQLLIKSITDEDELFPFCGTDLQQTFESSQHLPQLRIDTQQFSQLIHDTSDQSWYTSDQSLQLQLALPDVHELLDKVLTKRKSSIDITTVNKIWN